MLLEKRALVNKKSRKLLMYIYLVGNKTMGTYYKIRINSFSALRSTDRGPQKKFCGGASGGLVTALS